jgi:hypothetical protein
VRGQRHAPAALHRRERYHTHCTGGWVGPRAGLDRCEKYRLHRDSIPGPSSPKSVAIPTELHGPSTWKIWWAPNNASKGQMEFNSESKGLKSHKNNGHFTWRPTYIYENISLISSHNEKCFRLKTVEKIKTCILCRITFIFPRRSCRSCDNEEIYRTARQATEDTIIRRVSSACWIRLHTHTQNKLYLRLFHDHSCSTNMSQCYVYTYTACLVS